MKKQKIDFENEELELLSEELDSRDMYVLGYLKGFDRKTLKKWGNEGLLDFSVDTV